MIIKMNKVALKTNKNKHEIYMTQLSQHNINITLSLFWSLSEQNDIERLEKGKGRAEAGEGEGEGARGWAEA